MKKNIKVILSILVILVMMFSTIGILKVSATEANTENPNSLVQARNLEEDTAKVSETVGETGVENQGDVDAILYDAASTDVGEEKIEYISGDIYKAENNIYINNNVDGNIFVVGKDVVIEAESIVGDIFVVGENVEINAYVSGSVFAVAKDLTIKGVVNDVYAMSEKITLSQDSFIYRDAKLFAKQVNSNGSINGNLYASSEEVVISEDASSSAIMGNVYYTGKIVGGNGVVGDKIFVETNNDTIEEVASTVTNTITITSIITSVFTALIVVGVIILITTVRDKNFKSDMNKKIVSDTLLGLGVFVVVPIVCMILICSIVGIGLALILALVYVFILALVVKPIVAIEVAKKTTENSKMSIIKIYLLSVVVYLLFVLIDKYVVTLGPIFNMLISLYGLGLISRKLYVRLFHKDQKETAKKVVESKVVSEVKEEKEVKKIEEAKDTDNKEEK